MTKKDARVPNGFFLNAERGGRGMRLSVGPVVSVSDFTDDRILLVSHGASLEILGNGLSISVFQRRGVEVLGAVREVRFLYGKN